MKIHHRNCDRLFLNLAEPGNNGIFHAGLFLVTAQTIRIRRDSGKLENVLRYQVRVELHEGIGIQKIVNTLCCRQREMMVTFRTNLQILCKFQVVNHLSTFGTFLPKTFWHFVFFLVSRLEGRFLKDWHNWTVLTTSSRDGSDG